MKLTEREIAIGILVVNCLCCGRVYKDHKLSNACSYSLIPNYGCSKCQGIYRGSDMAEKQGRFLPSSPGSQNETTPKDRKEKEEKDTRLTAGSKR